MNNIQHSNENFCCRCHAQQRPAAHIQREDNALCNIMSNPIDKEIAKMYVWKLLALNPHLRRANPEMKEKAAVLESDTAISIVAPHVLPSGKLARQINDWIIQKALKEVSCILKRNEKNGGTKDIPEIWITIPADPIEAFEEITDNKYGRGRRIRAQVKEFVNQFVYITEILYGIKVKEDGLTVRKNIPFISEVYGWLAYYREYDGQYRTTNNGRPSLELIRERESIAHRIRISPEYVKRVLMKPVKGTDIGSHHSFFPVSKDVLIRLKTNYLQDFYKPLCWYCWYAYTHGDGRSFIRWSFAYDSLYDSVTSDNKILQDRKAQIKKALIECTRVHNECFPDASPITIKFTKKGIEVFCSEWPTAVG